MAPRVPVIDVAPFLTGSDAAKAAVAAEVARACREIGFLVIAGHGVPQDLLDAVFSTTGAFFDLPVEEKLRWRPADGMAPRGYHALLSKNLARTLGVDAPPDLREQFYVGPLVAHGAAFAGLPDAAPFYQPNIWPDRPDGLRPVLTRFYQTMEGLAGALMRVFALGLGLPERHFDGAIDRHFSTVPANFYPAPVGDPAPGQLRAGAHTDFGSLTILAMNDAPGGLQVQMQDGTWQDVAAGPGELIVNLGDMMQRWTNDRWKSTVHRVVNPPAALRGASRRQTVGFFLHPNYDAEIACLPTCCGPGDPARYAPILAGDQMRQKMQARAV
jgi:isopenicillin N synthase-like dioxygenase